MSQIFVTASTVVKLPHLSALLLTIPLIAAAAALDSEQSEKTQRGQHRSWQLMTPLPEGAVFAGTVAGNDGRIYVMSGFKGPDTEGLTAANRVYAPATDR